MRFVSVARCLLGAGCWLFILLGDAAGQPRVSMSVQSVNEAAGNAILDFRLERRESNPVRVAFNTSAGQALVGADFLAKTGEVVFAPGTVVRKIFIPLVNDRMAEPSQSFTVNVRPLGEVVVTTPIVQVTILDDDPDPFISLVSTNVTEGSGGGKTLFSLEILLSERTEKSVFFNLITTPDSASEFEFDAYRKRHTFVPKAKRMLVTLSVNADDEFEDRQQFYVSLRAPENALLDPAQFPPNETARIREVIYIYDDDRLTPPPQISQDRSFAWVGSFDGTFTADELDALAKNYKVVVIEKFHAYYNIQAHHQEATELRRRKPDIKILPYFNAKFWFPISAWGVTPEPTWLLKDLAGVQIKATTRTPAFYYDLRSVNCRAWILQTVEQWLATGLYDGIAFDSASILGDFGGGEFWQEALGAQGIADWNVGLHQLLADASLRFSPKWVLFNGIARHAAAPPDRGLSQLAFTSGASSERFAIELSGQQSTALLDDIELLRTQTSRVLLMKSNLKDTRDPALSMRAGRFSYGAFLMGWTPGQSFFKFALDDFYTAAELDDDPPETQLELGLPLGNYAMSGALLWREFEFGAVAVNTGATALNWERAGISYSVPAEDGLFLLNH